MNIREKKIKKYFSKITIKVPNGFGANLFNIYRKILLSKIEGNCVYYLKIKNVNHEFCYVNGILQDILEISLRLKKLMIKTNFKKIKIFIKKKGPCYLKGKDLNLKNLCIVLNKDYKICKINKGFKFIFEIGIKKGKGYTKIKKQKNKKIYLDNCYTPILNVRKKIIKKKKEEYLNIYIKTNKTTSPIKSFYACYKLFKNET
ncbi:hypothetical protein ACT2CI_00805 [Candidatus Vidania fulgoroideorum]